MVHAVNVEIALLSGQKTADFNIKYVTYADDVAGQMQRLSAHDVHGPYFRAYLQFWGDEA